MKKMGSTRERGKGGGREQKKKRKPAKVGKKKVPKGRKFITRSETAKQEAPK